TSLADCLPAATHSDRRTESHDGVRCFGRTSRRVVRIDSFARRLKARKVRCDRSALAAPGSGRAAGLRGKHPSEMCQITKSTLKSDAGDTARSPIRIDQQAPGEAYPSLEDRAHGTRTLGRENRLQASQRDARLAGELRRIEVRIGELAIDQ